jgi:intermembrane space import and assembly protein 40
MQDCFRQYPEIYGAELQDEEEAESSEPLAGAEGGDLPEPTKAVQKVETPETEATDSQKPGLTTEWKAELEEKREDSKVIPKKAVDATAANAGKQQ